MKNGATKGPLLKFEHSLKGPLFNLSTPQFRSRYATNAHLCHVFLDNAIPIKSWFSDASDTALLNLLPMLDALRFVSDVRSVLSRNLHLHKLWQ